MSNIILKVSEEVAAGTDVADTYTPAAGINFRIKKFIGEAVFSQNSAVCLIWDYGGTEEFIWSVKGSGSQIPHNPTFTGDGVKKLAVECKNGEAGLLLMAGYAEVRVYD